MSWSLNRQLSKQTNKQAQLVDQNNNYGNQK